MPEATATEVTEILAEWRDAFLRLTELRRM